jgi:hypothetical protein
MIAAIYVFNYTYVQGSQMSVNSSCNEARHRFDLDISGMIELKLSYDIDDDSLEIFIRQCMNLIRVKRQQTLNPYVFMRTNH